VRKNGKTLVEAVMERVKYDSLVSGALYQGRNVGRKML
jgi:hypothetical protein